ncbi:MAG: transcriptional regulator [Acidobacteria bacterium]|nr:MAG: transcriptional regulator [Acidobacteriota bacterium]
MAKSFKELQNKRSPESRMRVQQLVDDLKNSLPLQGLRQARQLTQLDLAKEMGTSQTNISKIEKRTDMHLSTLRRYIHALGGELRIIAHFPDGDIPIDYFSER